jgi:multidrug efflux pump subunit AcrB
VLAAVFVAMDLAGIDLQRISLGALVIARDSVILVDRIEKETAHGREPWDAVVEATARRFRPILLTVAAAILGMIPIAQNVFWGAMAFAIVGGLAVAKLLTLVFPPALYVTWFRVEGPGRDVCQRVDTEQTALVAQ